MSRPEGHIAHTPAEARVPQLPAFHQGGSGCGGSPESVPETALNVRPMVTQFAICFVPTV